MIGQSLQQKRDAAKRRRGVEGVVANDMAVYKVKLPAEFRTGTVRPTTPTEASTRRARLAAAVEARRSSVSPSDSSEENYPGLVNGSIERLHVPTTRRTAGGGERATGGGERIAGGDRDDDERPTADAGFDASMGRVGRFPPRLPGDWTEAPHTATMPSRAVAGGDASEDPILGGAFRWVPSDDGAEEGHRVRPTTAELPLNVDTAAPLEWFDDPEFETSKAMTDWLEKADKERDAPGSAAKSRYYSQHGQFSWEPCYAVAYDEADETFLIEWKKTPGSRKKVKRLNVLFDAESRPRFRTRLAAAMTMRERHEARSRYHAFVEKQPFTNDDRAILNEEFKRRVMRGSDWDLACALPHVVDEEIEAAREDYRRAVKRSVVDLDLRVANKAKRMRERDGVEQIKFAPPTPARACAEYDGERPFYDVQDDVIASLPVADETYLATAQKFYRDIDARELTLIDADDAPGSALSKLRAPMTLKTYEEYQRNHLEACEDALKSSMVAKTVGALQDLEHEALMLHESIPKKDRDARAASAAARERTMPRFVRQISLTIKDQIRTVVLNSVTGFRDFWSRFEGGDAAVAAVVNYHLPFLRVDLVVRDGAPAFDPPLQTVQDVVLALFDDALAAVRGIADVRDELAKDSGELDDDAAPPEPVATPADDEPTIKEAREIIRDVVAENFKGPRELAKTYEQFEELMEKPEPEPEPEPEAVEEGEAGAEAGAEAAAEAPPPAEGAGAEAEAGAEKPAEGDTAPAADAVPAAEGEAAAAPPPPQPVVEEEEDDEGDDDYAAAAAAKEKKKLTLPEIDAEVKRLAALAVTVDRHTETFVPFRMIGADCKPIKTSLIDTALGRRTALLTELNDEFDAINREIVDKFTKFAKGLEVDCDTAEDLDALMKFCINAHKEMAKIREETIVCGEMNDVFETNGHVLSNDSVETYWSAVMWPAVMLKLLAGTDEKVEEWKKTFKKQLKNDQRKLSDDTDEIGIEVDKFVSTGDFNDVEDSVIKSQDIDDVLKRLGAEAALYASREELFELPKTDYPQLVMITKAFEPYKTMWALCGDFTNTVPQWMTGPFTSLDPEKMSNKIDNWYRALLKIIKNLKGPPLTVGETLKGKIEEFRERMPLIAAMRNPGLRDRHWATISEKVGFAVKADKDFSIARALQLDLPAHLEVIEGVSENASKEYSLERTLDKMQGDWTGIVFETAPWRETGSTILKGLDETQMLLDDQIVKTQSMRSSPYIGPFEDRVKLWEAKINTIQEVMDAWLKCQNGWLYLEPIFGSDDIMSQMPTEGRKFKTVDTTWRKTMLKLEVTAEVIIVGSDEELLATLNKSNGLLDEVNKGLSEYLETKRLAFPRFYFLSNDELLEILSETKDPLRVQPFLKKVFEAINLLEFQKNLEVTAMLSEEGERVKFKNSFNPKKAGGNVEKWLIECEAAQRETVADVCVKSSEAYATSKRTDWMVKWPGQVVLCIGSLYWTAQTEEAITKGEMPAHAKMCSDQLMDIVEKVRGNLTKLQRKTLSALVVLEVHARDVVADLAAKNVPTPDDFEWASQLRYTWDTIDGEKAVMVRMINAAIPYGNEYLGNSSRLVITPLTDRCYRTLMGAVHLDVGGAPEGPAGTGKTETTKDLAKAIAMQCVVFNCSDGLDYLAMAKFFKGLAASGAWACFDEFNRIDLEVLSVIAQQILTITRAKAQRQLVFEFEGTMLPLRRTCNVFITMNPGYAGRSELPDNLKALFRTVAMMVPDYAMIAEIMLYSCGYLDARALAIKLVATYKLCSEQLSSQSHYDYGMRAVISVLRAAGAVKLKYPDQDESILMLISLKDVNLPKFLAPDIPLFNNILSDLFPGVELPEPDYDHMRASLLSECEKANLQPTPVFMEKTFQLYEMILVRHGLMLVGYSYGAKTSMYRMLAGALKDLNGKGLLEENKVKIVVINPKSIYMGQLYGQFDPVSHEWQDGILATKYRQCAVDTSPDRKWVMFDGPVDAIWIENMNTVLDDNKKLCLMSGEIIAMSNSMNMIFEVQDLAVASPATVSRCGMVYVEPSMMGWEPLKESWMNTLPASLETHKPRIEELFAWLVEPCMRFVRKNCKELIPTSDINLPFALMNIFESMIDEFKAEPCEVEEKHQINFIDCSFLFATIWSIGGTTETAGRIKFDHFFRALVENRVDKSEERKDFDLGPGLTITPPAKKLGKPLPAAKAGTVYNFFFNKELMGWRPWLETTKAEPLNPELDFQNIVVTTVDTVRYRYLFDLLTTHGKHVLFGGPTGTGKTVYIKQALNSQDRSKWTSISSTFSAQTNANQIQDIIDGKLDKRRKGIFGPPFGTKAVIFIDDLNMPQLEEYGAQPPIELLRQFMDHGGWYDRSELVMRKLVDIQFAAAMGPPGGGRNPVTPRLLRHFNTISVCDFDDASLTRVYSAIVEWWGDRAQLSSEVMGKASTLVKATLEIYNTIKRELLPTPAKSHYTYNMRDISKVWQGVSMVGAPPKDVPELVRLWAHENLRVFHDRLVNDEDRLWFFDFIRKMVDKHSGLKFDKVFAHLDADENGIIDIVELRKLMFADFVEGDQAYAEVLDVPNLLSVVEEQLVDYNQQSKTRMDLVLFLYAAEHICRISRVIRQDLGNALLVGVGGSGRQSLTRIAAYMSEYAVYSIAISKSYGVFEWHEDLKSVLRKAGGEGKPTVFLFNDTQIKLESFLEDINNILNTGEVPNLFAKDETAQVCDMVAVRAKKAGAPDGTMAELFQYFVQQCRANLHMVLCMSPVGDAFRERLRKFPSLVNCCTIDWFSEWPSDALQSVASQFLKDVEMEKEETRDACIEICQMMHQSVRTLAEKFLSDQGRFYYVTPTSYLELIGTYKTLLAEKRSSVSALRNRYESGLAQIFDAEDQVGVMKEELIALGPVLERTQVETDEILVIVAEETVEANKVREVVAKDEAFAAERAAEAKAIKDECEEELSVAIPMLEAALEALNTLTKADVTEVKAMKNPPSGVKLVMEAVCILKGIKPDMVKDPKGGLKKVPDYWGPSQKLLGDTSFLPSLHEYDKDNMDPKIIKAIKPFIAMPEFEPEVILKASKAAYGLCCWARAMEAYDRVAKVVAPKKARLAEAEAEYNVLMDGLNEKRAKLQEVEDKLQALNDKLEAMQAKKVQLENDVVMCEKKLERAEKLIGGLGGEKERWKEVAAELAVDYANLTGDVLICAGYIAYLGAFTLPYREEVLQSWKEALEEKEVPCASAFKLATVLGEPVKIRDWTIDGLPNDSFSVDNAIVMSKSRRWPLIIDPQGQANKWIRNMEKKNSLAVVKLTDGDFIRKLESSIQFGFPVLLENVGEELDPTLEPLLLKSVFKQGGSMCIKLGDNTVEYHENFRFYITSKLRNPHYLPETSVKVTLLNMMITIDGLTDQLLGIAVAKERPDLEEEKVKLVLQGAENARQLKEVEDKIIEVLGSSEGSILESETAINVISSAKELSNEINRKQEIAAKTEEKIDATRLGYRPVAIHVAHLFFNVGELCNIEPMYQYSLAWYVNLFTHAIEHAEKSSELTERLDNLIDFFTYSLYKNICRSLFEKDKLLFSFTLAATIFGYKGTLDPTEYRFLLTGGLGNKAGSENIPCEWLSEKLWLEMMRLSDLPKFSGAPPPLPREETPGTPEDVAVADGDTPADAPAVEPDPEPEPEPDDAREKKPSFCEMFRADPAAWKHVYDSATPETEDIPEPWRSDLDAFQKLLVLRTIRPDKLTRAIQLYVDASMGRKFIEPPPFDLDQCYADSTCFTPLVFVLSPGSDPMDALLKYGDSKGIHLESLSLGQGQGAKAEKLIKDASAKGSWVVLQNCHLAVSWMTTLDRICEEFVTNDEPPHEAFRIWLTSYPSPHFPVAVLQNGIKMTNEPPKGMRANMMQSFTSDPVSDPAFFDGCSRPKEWKKLLVGLAFFHAFIQERKNFGPLGWNIPYGFNDPDLKISLRQLRMFLNEASPDQPLDVPLKALVYLVGECNYGGRVTDGHDRRTLMTILTDEDGGPFHVNVMDDAYAFSPSKNFFAPPEGDYESYLEYFKSLPIAVEPEVFGLHANADITKDQGETDLILDSILSTQGNASSGGGKSKDEVLAEVAAQIRDSIPPVFDLEVANYKYPVDYYESMNSVLCQELVRFNRLLSVIHKSIGDFSLALKGLIVMTGDLDALGHAMYDGKIPTMWAKKSYPSLKPLAAYVTELLKRIAMLQKWIDEGSPPMFWITGFFFTHAFLTGVLQNYARKYKLPIDTVVFDFQAMKSTDDFTKKPADGAYCDGMFLEGCKWSETKMALVESDPKVLFTEMPVFWFKPTTNDKRADFPHYLCPIYRTAERRGVLATTGHSSNFVINLTVPSDKPQNHWIKRGVAGLLSLSY